MLLMNPCTHDTRVMKQATSLTTAGYDVHVVALMKPGLERLSIVDGVSIHRINPNLVNVRFIISVFFFCCGVLSLPKIKHPKKWFVQGIPRVYIFLRGILSLILLPISVVLYVLSLVFTAVLEAIRWTHQLLPHGFRKLALISRVKVLVYRAVQTFSKELPVPIDKEESIIEKLLRIRFSLRRLLFSISKFLPYSYRLHSINIDLARRALELKPEIIQSHDCNTLLGGAMIKNGLGIPLVYDSHELYLERNIGTRSRWWDKLQWGPIEKKCIQHCDVVMTVSQGIVEHLNKQYQRDDVVLVRNVQPYHEPPPRNQLLRKKLGISMDKKIGLYIGAITFNRGIEELIQAAVHLENSVIVIMGPAINPHYVDELKSTADGLGVLNKTVFFRGPVESDEVLTYVASANIGVVPTQACCLSYEFESSNKIFHCVMAGIPLAMSNHIEKRILVEQYGIGVLFDETNPKDIAQVIDKFVQSDSSLKSYSSNCLEAAKELCWEKEKIHLLRSIGNVPHI